MSDTRMTSTGHAVSDTPCLHFQTALADYEEALRFVGIEPGWTVLDAGCGSGGYVPLLCELVGHAGARRWLRRRRTRTASSMIPTSASARSSS